MVFKAKSFKSFRSKFNQGIDFDSLPLWLFLLTLLMHWIWIRNGGGGPLQWRFAFLLLLPVPPKQSFSWEQQPVSAAFFDILSSVVMRTWRDFLSQNRPQSWDQGCPSCALRGAPSWGGACIRRHTCWAHWMLGSPKCLIGTLTGPASVWSHQHSVP